MVETRLEIVLGPEIHSEAGMFCSRQAGVRSWYEEDLAVISALATVLERLEAEKAQLRASKGMMIGDGAIGQGERVRGKERS